MKGWKKICRNTMIAMVSAGALMSVPVPVLAYVDASAEETKVLQENASATNTGETKEQTVPTQAANQGTTNQNSQTSNSNAFSTSGNGQVQDSISDSSTKEFYTIKTKNNNTYYLVIDHANNIDNVYMLSEIDENDLKQFLTEDSTKTESGSSVTAGIVLDEEKKDAKTDQKSDVTDPSKEETSKKKDSGFDWSGYGLLGIVVAVVGAAGYYFKIYKPKKEEEESPSEGMEE